MQCKCGTVRLDWPKNGSGKDLKQACVPSPVRTFRVWENVWERANGPSQVCWEYVKRLLHTALTSFIWPYDRTHSSDLWIWLMRVLHTVLRSTFARVRNHAWTQKNTLIMNNVISLKCPTMHRPANVQANNNNMSRNAAGQCICNVTHTHYVRFISFDHFIPAWVWCRVKKQTSFLPQQSLETGQRTNN